MDAFTASEGSEQARFVAAFDYATSQVLPRQQLNSFLFLYYNRKFNKSCKVVHSFVDNIISRALASSERKTDGEKSQYCFLDGLISSVTDPQRLRSELLNILLAGRDTTAGLLSHVFFVLAHRPDVWSKLESEIEELNLHGEAPSYDQLKQMTYLRYVLNESKSC